MIKRVRERKCWICARNNKARSFQTLEILSEHLIEDHGYQPKKLKKLFGNRRADLKNSTIAKLLKKGKLQKEIASMFKVNPATIMRRVQHMEGL